MDSLVIGRDVMPPAICSHCHADEMGCGVKLGLGGRPCCNDCEGPQSHEGAEDLDQHHVAEDLHDQDHVDHHDHRGDDQ